MKPNLAIIFSKQGTLQNGLLALLTTILQISTVLVAEDADSGVRMLQDHRPRFLLLDMDLAEDGATTVLEQIKSQSLHTGVIAFVDSMLQGQKAEYSGADRVLLKGFSAAKFISSIEEILEP